MLLTRNWLQIGFKRSQKHCYFESWQPCEDMCRSSARFRSISADWWKHVQSRAQSRNLKSFCVARPEYLALTTFWFGTPVLLHVRCYHSSEKKKVFQSLATRFIGATVLNEYDFGKCCEDEIQLSFCFEKVIYKESIRKKHCCKFASRRHIKRDFLPRISPKIMFRPRVSR